MGAERDRLGDVLGGRVVVGGQGNPALARQLGDRAAVAGGIALGPLNQRATNASNSTP